MTCSTSTRWCSVVPTGWVCLPGIDPLVIVDNPAIVVESVKLAEDRSGDVVVRLYESRGASAKASVTPTFEAAGAMVVDLLERELSLGDLASVSFHPFEVVSLRIKR